MKSMKLAALAALALAASEEAVFQETPTTDEIVPHRRLMSNTTLHFELCNEDNVYQPAAGRKGRQLFVTIVSAVEFLGLLVSWRNKMTGWEPLWVVGVEVINYFIGVFPGPDGEGSAGDLILANGYRMPWLRFVGWLITCPVLLMGLVAMTTHGGKAATVRLVPLLIANQCMILCGITASSYSEGMLKWMIYVVAISFGSVVFTMSAQCLGELYKVSCRYDGDEMSQQRARLCAGFYAISFLVGWGCFPTAYTLGRPGTKLISPEVLPPSNHLAQLQRDSFVRPTASLLLTSPQNPWHRLRSG